MPSKLTEGDRFLYSSVEEPFSREASDVVMVGGQREQKEVPSHYLQIKLLSVAFTNIKIFHFINQK